MFIRFVILQKDSDSQLEQGLFQAADELWQAGSLADYEAALVRETFRWFNANLPVPGRFSRSRRPGAHKKGVSWFKPTAREFIDRIADLAAVLTEHGYHVERLTTERPGYVVYEDDYQIVAEVFRGE